MNDILIKKYDVAGPRYTSYPTVPYWEQAPTSSQHLASLKQLQAKAVSIYVHIPFCESLCTYCGCNTRITQKKDVGLPYVKTLLKEWKMILPSLESQDNSVEIGQIHLGGGTPTFLDLTTLTTLLNGLKGDLNVAASADCSIEADPRVTTQAQLELLYEFGFRRLSLGVQDFDPHVQAAVHRIQSYELVSSLTQTARRIGFSSINFDLIYGLPFQTEQTMSKTIQQVIALKPDRIAFYSYAHVPWIKNSQRRFQESDLPSGSAKRALYEIGKSAFESNDYLEIGMDHFALKTDPLFRALEKKQLHRNFMGYTEHSLFPIIGLGVSAISDSWSILAQNEKILEHYISKVENGLLPISRGHCLTHEDQILRRHILNIMCNLETDFSNDLNQIPFLKSIEPQLDELARDGLLERMGGALTVKPLGKMFLRNIAMTFDARLFRKQKEHSPNLFSRTV